MAPKIRKLTSRYVIINSYEVEPAIKYSPLTNSGEIQINLEIDEDTKSFKIISSDRDGMFRFTKNSNINRWKAIADCLLAAIEFSEKHLKESGESND